MRFTRDRALTAAGCATVVALALLSPRLVPFCMDEFVHYQVLGCATHPLTRRFSAYTPDTVFREGCGDYDLRLPFTTGLLPLRAYHYIGSLPALPFWPFWRFLGDPVAARLQGACFLLLAAWLAARLARTSFADMLAGALVFPAYALAFVVDLGPVGISLLLLSLTLHAVRRAVSAPSGVAWAALAGGIAYLGLWTKLVFAWVLPAIFLFAVFESRGTPRGVGRRVLCAAAFLLTCTIPTALLLVSRDADGTPYYDIVRQGNISLEAAAQDLGLHPALRLLRFFVNGSEILPRTLHLARWPLDVVPLLIAALLLVIAVRARAPVLSWLLLAAATFASTVLTRSAWGPHHAAFTFFFLAVALGVACSTLGRRTRIAVLLLMAGYWILLILRLPTASVEADTSFGKDVLLRAVHARGLDGRSVQVHTSWGTFYIAHLFSAQDAIVLWSPGLSDHPEALSEVRRIAKATHRGVVEISLRPVERLATSAALAALGPTRHVESYGNWQLVEYAEPRD